MVYVLVDDWYHEHGRSLLCGTVGAKAAFSDREVITLLLDYRLCPGER